VIVVESLCHLYVVFIQIVVYCRLRLVLLVMEEDPNQLIEAPEDDDINDLNEETFGSFVENCRQFVVNLELVIVLLC